MLNISVNHAERMTHYAKPMETMGDRIRYLRGVKGYSQSELAKLVGVTKSAVSQWENGQTANVKLATFLRLCDALAARAEYLIYGPARAGVPRPPSSARGAGQKN